MGYSGADWERIKAKWEPTRAEWEAQGFKLGPNASVLPWESDCPVKDLVRLREDGVYESLGDVEPLPEGGYAILGPAFIE